MTTKTFIPGKQSALEDSIQKMEGLLSRLGFEIESAPVLNPVQNIYSQHIYDRRCRGIFTNGKGACEKSCYASALGEFLERLSTNYFFSDFYLTPNQSSQSSSEHWLHYPDEKTLPAGELSSLLTPELWKFYQSAFDQVVWDQKIETFEGENEGKDENVAAVNPASSESFVFEDFLSLNDHFEQVRALPLTAVKTNQTIYFPINLFANLYASNGLSAGNTALEAQIQGLSEIFERWVKNKVFQDNICLPEIPRESIAPMPTIERSIVELESTGLKVSVRDASLGGKYPVINVTLIDPAKGNCFASFGAHPIFEVALERTLTESLQGRHLDALQGFQTPVHDLEIVADAENLENHFIDSSGLIHSRFLSVDYDFELVPWTFAKEMPLQWQQLCELVWEQGTDVYIGHYNQYGFDAVRIIVPGMSEVYPLVELIDNNQNNGRVLRDALFALDTQLPLFEQQESLWQLIEVIEAIGASDHQGVANLIGLMADKESFWAHVDIVQLRFWCYLAVQDWTQAYEQAQDAQFYVQPNNPWKLWLQAYIYLYELVASQQLTIDEFLQQESAADLSSFWTLFRQHECEEVLDHLRGKYCFAKQPLGKDIFTQCQTHNVLINIYEQLQEAKLQTFL